MANYNNEPYNMVHNWHLYVHSATQTPKGVMLRCSLSGKKKKDGTYAKAMNVSVFVGQTANVNFPQGVPFEKQNISVDGTFSTDDDYVSPQNGAVYAQHTIFATSVNWREKKQNNNQQGYQQNAPAPYPQGGYQQNAPVPYPQGGYQQNAPTPYPQGGYQQSAPTQQNAPAPYPQGGYQQNAPAPYPQGGYQQSAPVPNGQDNIPQQNYVPQYFDDGVPF